jgi:glycosyltransferase involved in cell wall biosynthesis
LKTAKIKVLYMIESLGSGGVERQLVELLRAIKKYKEFESEVIVMSNVIHYTEIHALGVKLHKLVRKRRWDFEIFPRLYGLVRQFQPDIIYSWSSMCSMYVSPVSWVLGVAFLNGIVQNAPLSLGLMNKEYRRLKLTLPFSDVVLTNSYAGLRAYRVPDKKGICIYNGFNPDRVMNLPTTEEIRQTFNIATEHVVGMVGRFHRERDYTIYFEAAARICRRRDDVTFLGIGEGPDLERFKAMYHDQPRIRIIGPQRSVEAIIKVFTVGVLVADARYAGEGIANAIMEYMALGKPVIATNGGGTPEIVEHAETGFLIHSGDTENLERRIIELLDAPRLAAKLGAAGRTRIAERFGIDQFVERHAALFRALAKRQLSEA